MIPHQRKLNPVRRARRAYLLTAFLTASPFVCAQDDQEESPTFELNPFAVSSAGDFGYRKANSITAMRIGAPVIETPLNISIVSRELIEDLAVRNNNQLFFYNASVKSNFDTPSNAFTGSESAVKIRGFGTTFTYQDGFRRSTGTHIDGIERVEIVKGPNGLYFGRTDPGGIINFVTKRAEMLTASELVLSVGNDNYYKGLIDHQGVIVEDALGYRVVGSYRDSDDWFDDTHWDEEYVLGTLRWRPVRNFELDAKFEYFNQNRDGGRVGAIVANLGYLDAWEKGELAGQAEGNLETLAQYRVRIFNETGEDPRNFNGFWFPRGHSFNRNGAGSFDDNLDKTFTLDSRWMLTEKLNARLAWKYSDTNRDVSWLINQDPHQSPDIYSTYFNGGVPTATAINYGFFQSPRSGRDGSGVPGRQWETNKTHSLQGDLTHDFNIGGTRHALIGAVEFIATEYSQGGYLTDRDAFVAAGAIPGGVRGFGDDEGLSAESNALLVERREAMVAMGLLAEGEELNPGLFSRFYVDVADPTAQVPNLRSWLAGRTPRFTAASDSIDRSASLAYRGHYFEDKLVILGGARYVDYRTVGVNNSGQGDDNVRERREWAKYTDTLVTAGANYYVTPELVLYASTSQTFLPVGGINPLITNIQDGRTLGGDPLEPQEGNGWEVGIKTDLHKGMISGAVSYFEITRENLVISDRALNDSLAAENLTASQAGVPDDQLPWRRPDGTFIALGNSSGLQTNGGEQATTGVEFEFVITPIRNFQAIVSYMHLFDRKWVVKDPQLVHVSRGGDYQGMTREGVLLDDGKDVIPDTLENVPSDQFSLWGKYTFDQGPASGLSLGFGGNYQSAEIHMARTNGDFASFTTGSHWRFDALIGYQAELLGNPLLLNLAVNNVFDQEIVSGSFGLAPTREWTLSARYRF